MSDVAAALASGDLVYAGRLMAEGAPPEVGHLTDPAALDLVVDAAGTIDVPGMAGLISGAAGLGRTAVVRALLRHGVEIPAEVVDMARSRGHVEIVRLCEDGLATEVGADDVRTAQQAFVTIISDAVGASVCYQDLLVFWDLTSDAPTPERWMRLEVNSVTALEVNAAHGLLGIGCEDEGVLELRLDGSDDLSRDGRQIGDRTGVGRIAAFDDGWFEVPAHRPNDQILAVATAADGGLAVVDAPDMRGDDLALRVVRHGSDLSTMWEWHEPDYASFTNCAVAFGDGRVGLSHRTDRGERWLSMIDDGTGESAGSVLLDWDRSMIWREPLAATDDGFVVLEGLRDVRLVGDSGRRTIQAANARVTALACRGDRLVIGTDRGLEVRSLD